MLAIDGKPFAEYSETEPIIKHINEALRVIKKQRVWKLVVDDSMVLPPKPGMPESVKESNQGILQPARGKYMFDGIEHEITYYTNINFNNGIQVYLPRYVDFNTLLPLDPQKQADLIFFMVCVSPACRPYQPVQPWQYIRPNSTYYYKVEDRKMDIIINNETMRIITRVKKILWDDDGASVAELREFGKAYGINNADVMDIEELRFELDKRILKKDDKGRVNTRLINDFISTVSDSGMLKLRETLRDAIDHKYFVTGKNTLGKLSWYMTDKYLERGKHVFTIPEGEDKELALLKYYAKHPKRRSDLKAYLKTKKESNPNPVPSGSAE